MKRIPRLLVIAFALSLLVHLIVALIMRPPTPTPQGPAEVVSIEHRPATIAVTKMRTPPPAPPKHTPAPRTVTSAPPRRPTGLEGPAGTAYGTPPAPTPAPATPTPAPAATSRRRMRAAQCRRCNRGLAAAARHRRPGRGRKAPAASRWCACSSIRAVKSRARASCKAPAIRRSTWSPSRWRAMRAIRPALRDCKPVAGDYTFSVKFVAW